MFSHLKGRIDECRLCGRLELPAIHPHFEHCEAVHPDEAWMMVRIFSAKGTCVRSRKRMKALKRTLEEGQRVRNKGEC